MAGTSTTLYKYRQETNSPHAILTNPSVNTMLNESRRKNVPLNSVKSDMLSASTWLLLRGEKTITKRRRIRALQTFYNVRMRRQNNCRPEQTSAATEVHIGGCML